MGWLPAATPSFWLVLIPEPSVAAAASLQEEISGGLSGGSIPKGVFQNMDIDQVAGAADVTNVQRMLRVH